MTITITSFTQEHEPAVRDFNERLKKHKVAFQFPENNIPAWLPKARSKKLYQDFYVAVENNNVRGAYVLKHQPFQVGDKTESIGNYGLPLSEGIIDKRYVHIGLRLLNDALSHQPKTYALGMGGIDKPLPKFLRGMGWKTKPVPFYYYVVNSGRFFKNVSVLRSGVQKIFGTILSVSGIGWIVLKLWQGLNTKFKLNSEKVEPFESFEDWSDKLWEEAKQNYALCAIRISEILNILYPPENNRFIKLTVTTDNKTLGWVVLLDSQMKGHKYFGNLRVGSIIDCFSKSDFEKHIIAAAKNYLIGQNVDLIVTNQSHNFWRDACEQSGFINGPTNFILALSPQLWQELEDSDSGWERVHFTRGDGDGPINL